MTINAYINYFNALTIFPIGYKSYQKYLIEFQLTL